jgi:hypothetical protein
LIIQHNGAIFLRNVWVILLIDAEAYQRTKSSQAPYLHKKPSYAVIDERTSLLAFVNAENAYYFIISVRLPVLIFQNISAARTEKKFP